jgi:hypothetical protein
MIPPAEIKEMVIKTLKARAVTRAFSKSNVALARDEYMEVLEQCQPYHSSAIVVNTHRQPSPLSSYF